MCDTITAVGPATSENVILFGKNSDREFNEAQFLELIPGAQHAAGTSVKLTYKEIAQAAQTETVLISRPHWIWGAEIGTNAHGLVIGNEAIFSKEASLEPGVTGIDYLRLALERARCVDEAISVITELLREHGQSGNCGYQHPMAYHISFILADAGGAKVLETVDREWVTTSVRDFYAISNALSIETTFEESSPAVSARATELRQSGAPFSFKAAYENKTWSPSGEYRRGRAMELLREHNGWLQTADFFRILRDHREGPEPPGFPIRPRLCMHTDKRPLYLTTASWVASLSPGKAVHWITATSAPCTGLFKPILLECGLPKHGPAPGAEEEDVSLWWRHEQFRRHLAVADEQLRKTYQDERDFLESKFIARMADCPRVTDQGTRAEAQYLIELCWSEARAFEAEWYRKRF